MLGRDVPVLPDPDRARELLRRELLDPAYQTGNPIRRLLDWLDRLLSAGAGRAGALDGVGLAIALALLLVLLLALGWFASRVRRTTRLAPAGDLVGTAGVDSATLRRRAEAALAAGRLDDVVIEGFRALAVRQVELGLLGETRSSTVTEVSAALAARHPERSDAVRAAARAFDAVRYGGRAATRQQAEAVLALDDDLAGVRR